jgi:hypothetical protein
LKKLIRNLSNLKFIGFVLLGLVVLTLFLVNFFSRIFSPPSENQASSVISNIKFHTENIDYPQEWPNDLILPDLINLVDYASGLATENDKQGWNGKFRFEGSFSQAEKMIKRHFMDLGWDIEKIEDSSLSEFVLLLSKDNGDGLVVLDIDPKDSNQIIIAISLFP